jgi:hypothetical protein
MKGLIVFFLVGISGYVGAQGAGSFPTIHGISLDDKKVQVPATNGKYSIIGIAFHRNAEDELKKWLNPLYESFIQKENGRGGLDLAEIHDVNFVFIPMIAGFRRVAEEFKKGTDKEYWPYIMDTEKTDVKELQKSLGVTDNKSPYFYAIDPKGKILATVSGIFQEKKLESLENAVTGD